MIEPRAQILGLYNSEYGDRVDIVMRVIGITLGGLLLFIYTGWAASYVWGLVFALVHAVQWPFLRSRLDQATDRDAVVGGGLFLIVHVSFIWLPTYLAAGEDPGLCLVGMLVLVATAMYHIRRADTALWLVVAQVIVFAAALGWVATAQIPRFDDLVIQLSVGMVTLMAIIYISMTMIKTHKNQLMIEDAAALLAQEQKMSAIGRLAGGVAHDLNNILAVTLGNAELLKHTKSTAHSELADEIIKAGERGSSLIRQLLMFAGRAHLAPTQLSLPGAISDLEKMLRRTVPETIAIKVEVAASLPFILADRYQLDTALLNLAINARDAMPDGGTLTIKAAEVHLTGEEVFVSGKLPTSKKLVSISISDTGLGVDEAIRTKIFDPFYTTKSATQGVGLGLSSVLGFAEQSGGAIQFTSKLGIGTTAVILLPTHSTGVDTEVEIEKADAQ